MKEFIYNIKKNMNTILSITDTDTSVKDEQHDEHNRSNRIEEYRNKKFNYMVTQKNLLYIGSLSQSQMNNEYLIMKKAYKKLISEDRIKVGKLPERFTII